MRGKSIVVLCEDEQHKKFIQYFLRRCGIKRNCRYIPVPDKQRASDGKRTADEKRVGVRHVCRKYPKELQAARDNEHLLLVMVDADKSDDRMRDLNKACADADILPRKESDNVGVFMPARAIETWLVYLKTGTFDADKKYHKNPPKKCKPQAEMLADKCRKKEALKGAPPSLQDACDKWKKVCSS